MEEKFTITIQVTAQQGEKIFKLLTGTKSRQAKYQERRREEKPSVTKQEKPTKPDLGVKSLIAYYRNVSDHMIYFDKFKNKTAMVASAKGTGRDYHPIGEFADAEFEQMKRDFLFVYNNNIEKLLEAYG